MTGEALLAGIVAVPFACGSAALFCRSVRALLLTVRIGAAAGVALAALALVLPNAAPPPGVLELDGLSRVLLAVTAAVGALSAAESFSYWAADLALGAAEPPPGRGLPRVRGYFFWHQAFVGSLLAAALSGNLGLSWVAIEATTVTSAVLVGFAATREAVEAAWKYVVLCSVGLALVLLTVILFYALSGGGGLRALDWTALRSAAAAFPTGPAKLAYIFALVGLGTKSGLAPLHAWLPDAHSEAPAPVSALLSGVLLATVLCTLVRVAGITAAATGPALPFRLLLGAGVVSVAVATPFIMLQEDLKRLLAYSSIEQIGLMAVGFGCHVPVAAAGAVLQLIVHAFAKSGLFFAAGHVSARAGTHRLGRLHALARSAPLLGGALLFGVVTLGGLPPFGMFWSEIDILRGALAVDAGLGLALLLLLGAIFGGLLFHAGRAAFGTTRGRARRPSRLPPRAAAVLLACAIASVATGFVTPPAVSRGVSAAAAQSLGGPAL